MANNQHVDGHPVISHQEWLEKRTEFLRREKEFFRQRDELNRLRRELPWEKVEKEYVFDGPDGKQTLAQLFGNKSQLFVYHFMFSPEWDEGCPHCSFWADQFDGAPIHLAQRDVSFVAISRAPLAKLQAFEQRMGWHFKWLSSYENDFNYDFFASFTQQELQDGTAFFNYRRTDPGMLDREGASAFIRDTDGTIYHTYSTFARGIDLMNSAYNILDMVARGRNETPGDAQDWVTYHDQYPDA